MWVATDKEGAKVYASGKGVSEFMKNIKKKKISQNKVAIGYMEKHGRTSIPSLFGKIHYNKDV